jgi:hypothetical protein
MNLKTNWQVTLAKNDLGFWHNEKLDIIMKSRNNLIIN